MSDGPFIWGRFDMLSLYAAKCHLLCLTVERVSYGLELDVKHHRAQYKLSAASLFLVLISVVIWATFHNILHNSVIRILSPATESLKNTYEPASRGSECDPRLTSLSQHVARKRDKRQQNQTRDDNSSSVTIQLRRNPLTRVSQQKQHASFQTRWKLGVMFTWRSSLSPLALKTFWSANSSFVKIVCMQMLTNTDDNLF